MGKLPQNAIDKFDDANENFRQAVDDPFAPGLPPPVPPRVDLQEIKKEIIELDARVKRIATGLADFKDATRSAFEEVKRELNTIEELLRRPRPQGVGQTAPIRPTGEQFRSCENGIEEDIYSWDGELTPPQVSVTGHGKNSGGVSECKIEFKFYDMLNFEQRLVHTDIVTKGSSTPTRRGRWTRVTAKCLSSPETQECRISWTVA